MHKPISIIAALLILFSCSSKQNSSDPVNADTTKLQVKSEQVASTGALSHPAHSEDENYPWFDTRLAGSWIQKDYLHRLVEIFENDTTLSLYEYVVSLDQCHSELYVIEIEGCEKENIFYLKNAACDDKYIAKSAVNVEAEKASLQDIYSGTTYRFESPKYHELFINGKEFVKLYDYRFLTEALDGIYVVYKNDTEIPFDTVNYRGGRFEKSDTLNDMQMVYLSYIGREGHGEPSIEHSDVVSFTFFTGDSTSVQLVDDAGEGMGYETVPETLRARFDLKRTSTGFELYDPQREELVMKFKKIGEFKRR